MTSLIPPELGHLLALRRVRRGHVVLLGTGLFLHQGRPIPGYLDAPLRDLLASGHLHLGERREWEQRPVLATTSGEQLHTTLENPES
ncbi:MAG: hypothetical protein ACR2FQ_00535 [Pseudonocardiaceae bacterium]